jgi:hypothetical protein
MPQVNAKEHGKTKTSGKFQKKHTAKTMPAAKLKENARLKVNTRQFFSQQSLAPNGQAICRMPNTDLRQIVSVEKSPEREYYFRQNISRQNFYFPYVKESVKIL